GGLLSLSSDLGTTASFLHFNVPASWSRLESVTFTGLVSSVTPGALALDDVGVGLGPSVGEPPTLLLALTAGVGLAAMLLLRRRPHFPPPGSASPRGAPALPGKYPTGSFLPGEPGSPPRQAPRRKSRPRSSADARPYPDRRARRVLGRGLRGRPRRSD